VHSLTPLPHKLPKINGSDSILSTYKINTDSRNIRLRVGIISKPKEQTGFTNTRISDKKEFKEIVAEYKIRRRTTKIIMSKTRKGNKN
jgi:hypothetical protein